MHGQPSSDGAIAPDWSRTSGDYAQHRRGYPESFYAALRALGIFRAGLDVLDLGTGTGLLARKLASMGLRVTGIDPAPGQIDAARALAAAEGLTAEFRVATAEETGLATASFDLVTASQAWLYFDRDRAVREVKRLLRPGGRLLTCHLCWLPRQDPIARATEALVLEHNPHWRGADWDGAVPQTPSWARGDFETTALLVYDEPIPYTREGWRGRIRACRGTGASLPAEAVARFDAAHDAVLRRLAGETFSVLHRIDAHVLAPVGV